MKNVKSLTVVLTKEKCHLLLLTMVYKLLLEFSLWKVLVVEYGSFTIDFNLYKYLNGLFWCIVAFGIIDCKRRRASTFFLFLIFVFQIIPITVVYSFFSLNSPIYYNCLLFSFVTCEVIIKNSKPVSFFKKNIHISALLLPFFLLVSLAVVISVTLMKGIPSLDALNIYNVYLLRREDPLEMSYLFNAVIAVFLPVLLVYFTAKRKYFFSSITAFSVLLMYLYSGHKTFFFSIVLCLIGVFYSKRLNCFMSFYRTTLTFFSLLCGLTSIWPSYEQYFVFAYDLFVRRVLLLPAQLKFYHFDYFNSHPFLALYGAIPRIINPFLPDYYEAGVLYPFEIGRIYYGTTFMSADTGFFAEIFSRFGYLGFIVLIIMLSFILLQIDALQFRTSYSLAVSFFLYPIYALTERPIVGTMFLGGWLFLFLLIFFYSEKGTGCLVRECYKGRLKDAF